VYSFVNCCVIGCQFQCSAVACLEARKTSIWSLLFVEHAVKFTHAYVFIFRFNVWLYL